MPHDLTWKDAGIVTACCFALVAALVWGMWVLGPMMDRWAQEIAAKEQSHWAKREAQERGEKDAESARLTNWCLGKGGSVHINSVGLFNGCTIAPK